MIGFHRKLDTASEIYREMRDTLQTNERILLQTIGFDVIIANVGANILKYFNLIKSRKILDKGSTKTIVLYAYKWSLCSYGSELCLLYEAEVLACAFLYGASHDLNMHILDDPAGAPPKGVPWWDQVRSRQSCI